MKKFITLFLVSLLLFTLMASPFGMQASAEEAESDQNWNFVKKVLRDSIDDTTYKELTNNDLYDESLSSYDLTDKPILTVISTIYWDAAAKGVDALIDATKDSGKYYIVLDETPFKIKEYSNENKTIVSMKNDFQPLPIFVKYIKETPTSTEKGGNLKEILCFDGASSDFQGLIIYCIYENSYVVNKYNIYSDNPKTFEGEEFEKYAGEYHEYLITHAYDENGNRLYGGSISFNEYVENPDKYTIDSKQNGEVNYSIIAPTPDILDKALDKEVEASPLKTIILTCVFIPLAVLLVASVTFIIYRRSKRKNITK